MCEREKTPQASFRDRMAAAWTLRTTSNGADQTPRRTASAKDSRRVRAAASQDSIRSSKRTMTVAP